MNHSFPWLFLDSFKIPWLFPDFLTFFQNSLTFPWLEKVVSFFQVFQCQWEPWSHQHTNSKILAVDSWLVTVSGSIKFSQTFVSEYVAHFTMKSIGRSSPNIFSFAMIRRHYAVIPLVGIMAFAVTEATSFLVYSATTKSDVKWVFLIDFQLVFFIEKPLLILIIYWITGYFNSLFVAS